MPFSKSAVLWILQYQKALIYTAAQKPRAQIYGIPSISDYRLELNKVGPSKKKRLIDSKTSNGANGNVLHS